MKGEVDAVGRPKVWIVLRGPLGSEGMSAFVDTRFNGTVSFPKNLAQRLGLLRRGSHPMQLADGRSVTEPMFAVEVEWIGGPVQVTGNGSDLADTLVGTILLQQNVLTIDFAAKTVEIR
jgi:predicted aspartyl protease